jgi:hypothetical protein
MTIKKLEELKKKFADGQGTTQDLGEILTDFFQSFSSHMKDLKGQITELKNNQEILYAEIHELKNSMNPVYTIIQDDEDDEDES